MGPHHDSPDSQYPCTPRSYRPTMAERDSFASTTAPFSSIGALLSQPYDSDDEDGRSIKHPQAYQGRQDQGLRQGDVRQQFNQGPAPSIKSHQGIVHDRPKSVVHFPGPMIGQHHLQNAPYSAGPTFQSQPRYPNPTHPGPRGGQTARPQPSLNIPGQRSMSPHPLPMPHTPISPALAAPPSASSTTFSHGNNGHLAPPKSAFASNTSRSSVASSADSVTGFEIMKEKHTMMRGGDEEVFMPMNPRRPAKKGTGSRNTLMGFRKTVFGQPGGEFWKRFSVMAKMEDFGKDSDWLAAEQARKRRIKIYAIVGIILIAVVIAGVVLGVLLTDNSHEDARPKSMTRPVDE